MPECLFCAAVAGSLPVETVLSTPSVVAFLDHRPVFKGHVLVVTREHVATLANLPERTDLLVIGSRGYGFMRRILLGGIVGALVRTAHYPVVVVPS